MILAQLFAPSPLDNFSPFEFFLRRPQQLEKSFSHVEWNRKIPKDEFLV